MTKLYRRRNLGVHEDVIFFGPYETIVYSRRGIRGLRDFAASKNDGKREEKERKKGGNGVGKRKEKGRKDACVAWADFLPVLRPLLSTPWATDLGALELSNEIIVRAAPRPRSIFTAPRKRSININTGRQRLKPPRTRFDHVLVPFLPLHRGLLSSPRSAPLLGHCEHAEAASKGGAGDQPTRIRAGDRYLRIFNI